MYVHDSLAYFLLDREPPWCAGCTVCRESPCRKEMPSLVGAGMEVFQYNREYSQSRSLMWVYLYGECFSCVFQKNHCVLPEDLRDFYLTTDGFMLAWNSKLESEHPETCTDQMNPIIVWLNHADALNLTLLYCFFLYLISVLLL